MDRKIVLALMLMIALAIALSFSASRFPVLPFDQKSYDELQEEASFPFNILMLGVSSLGDTPIPMVLTVTAISIFALRRQWLEAVFMLATTSNTLLAFALKVLIHRARPFPIAENVTGLIQSINQYSYPSGHVLFFVVFFGFFAYLAWTHFAGCMRVIAVILCAALIVLIGPSRIFLGAHWASDVVGSYIIGMIWLFFMIMAYQWAERWRSHDR